MAIIHRAQLTPSKLEALSAWVPTQVWARGVDTSSLSVPGAYRFDDPSGEVGIETHLVQAADGRVLHVPVTYRGAPLPGAEAALITTMRHTVLGDRWVYDGCADPAYVQALVTAVLTGGVQADLDVETDAGQVRRPPTTFAAGSGTADSRVPDVTSSTRQDVDHLTVLRGGGLEIRLLRVIGAASPGAGVHTLTGTWPEQDEPVVFATVEQVQPA